VTTQVLPQCLPPTNDLVALARRVVWFKEPSAALGDVRHFVAHALTFGTAEDVQVLRRHLADDQLRMALQEAPAGVFDARCWAYWNLMLDLPAGAAPPTRTPRSAAQGPDASVPARYP
jgi:hypothetical protein